MQLRNCGTTFSYQVKAQPYFRNQISLHKANTAFFAILDRKRVNNLLKKTDFYQYYDRNGTKLSSMHGIALVTEKNFESAAQLKRNKF